MTTSPGPSIHAQVRLPAGCPSASPAAVPRRAGPRPGRHINGGQDGEDPAERGRRMVRGTVRLRAATIGRTGRRKRGRGDQPRRAPARYPRLRQPDGPEFGDHPQAAAERMRWVRQLAAAAAAPATCEPGPEATRVGVHPRQLLTSGTSTEGTRHSEADTGPRRPPRRADSEPPRAEYHDPAIRRARQATARAARKTR